MAKIDLTGKQFGNLTVIEYLGRKHHASYWKCRCECGNEVNCYYGNLIRGTSTSCGCLRSYYAKQSRNCHGESRSRLYREWAAMRNRCYNKNSHDYNRYGGRGIIVCDEWQEYWPFREWAHKSGYDDSLSLDRKDVNGNYCPENCCWITMAEQQSNKRTNVYIEYNGTKKTVAQWAKELGMRKESISYRIKAGWTPEECLFGKENKITNCRPRMEIPEHLKP